MRQLNKGDRVICDGIAMMRVRGRRKGLGRCQQQKILHNDITMVTKEPERSA